MKRIHTSELRGAGPVAGERILLSGVLYTARDAAHRRFSALLDAGVPLPFSLKDAVLYYAGATPAPPGCVIGACGPTTAARMDAFAPRLYDEGVCATVGKGPRSEAVAAAIVRNGALYLCALGGAGALAACCITACEPVAFEDLGCEAVLKLTVQDFPLIVGIDAGGGVATGIGK